MDCRYAESPHSNRCINISFHSAVVLHGTLFHILPDEPKFVKPNRTATYQAWRWQCRGIMASAELCHDCLGFAGSASVSGVGIQFQLHSTRYSLSPFILFTFRQDASCGALVSMDRGPGNLNTRMWQRLTSACLWSITGITGTMRTY
jgi:hypothetical protein